MIAGLREESDGRVSSSGSHRISKLLPVLTIDQTTKAAAAYHYVKGNPSLAFEEAAEIIEETFETGYQEQAYIEPQGVIGVYANDKVTIYGSLQCPYYVKGAVMQANEPG